MSVTGFWIVAAVPSEAVSQLRATMPGERNEEQCLEPVDRLGEGVPSRVIKPEVTK